MYAYFLHFQNITYPEIHDLNNNVTHYCNLSKSVWITNILPSAEHGRIILHRSAGTYLLIYLNLPNCCVVLCIFVLFYVLFFVTFPVLFVCICVLNNCHRVTTQLQLNVYHIIWIRMDGLWFLRECGRVEVTGRAEEVTGNMSCKLKIHIFGNVILCPWVSFPDVSRAHHLRPCYNIYFCKFIEEKLLKKKRKSW